MAAAGAPTAALRSLFSSSAAAPQPESRPTRAVAAVRSPGEGRSYRPGAPAAQLTRAGLPERRLLDAGNVVAAGIPRAGCHGDAPGSVARWALGRVPAAESLMAAGWSQASRYTPGQHHQAASPPRGAAGPPRAGRAPCVRYSHAKEVRGKHVHHRHISSRRRHYRLHKCRPML